MKTLYDLLGAFPRDSAEELRTAFRRAVKGAHPDMRPGDPDAALKFREIVRASEILGDAEQRAVYDDLLKLAHLEHKPASGHPVTTGLRKMASVMTALTWASVVTVGGYFLIMYTSGAPVASIISLESLAALPLKSGPAIIASEPGMPPTARSETAPEAILASSADAAADLAPSEDVPPEGSSVHGYSDLKIRFADLDDALQTDTKVLPAYVDRGVIFYRIGKSDPGFPDIARAKRIEKPGRSKSVRTMSRKRRSIPDAIAAFLTPVSQRRTAPGASRAEAMASAVRLR